MPSPINPQAFYTNNTGYQIPQYAQVPQYSYQQPAIPQQKSEPIFVRGIKEAEVYPVNTRTVLWDAYDSVFYVKDQNGLKVADYKFRDDSDNPKPAEYVTKSEFDELKKLIDDLTK